MATDDILKGKKILIVDDEPDILEILKLFLEQCDIETAATFEEAKELLESNTYDVAILDIMGVRGFELLAIANATKTPALMLTAHGLSPDNLVKAIQDGAKSYIPKEKMNEIDVYLKEILFAKEEGVEKPGNWFARLSSFFDERFGSNWKKEDEKFWAEFDKNFKVSEEKLSKIKYWIG
jgi:DNA-binding NtrC family response regulator